jgi:cobalamin synthase
VLLVGWQWSLISGHMAQEPSRLLFAWIAAGLFGTPALASAHIGKPGYNEYDRESAFAVFGQRLHGWLPVAVSFGTAVLLALLLAKVLLPGNAVRTVLLCAGVAAAAGILLRRLVLKALGAYNGDIIGFVTLPAEAAILTLLLMDLG